MGCSIFGDPGPCPVDDTPHTACTPESLAARSSLTVALPAPLAQAQAIDGMAALLSTPPAPAPVPAPEPAPVTFTTATYRRATHGKAVRNKR